MKKLNFEKIITAATLCISIAKLVSEYLDEVKPVKS